MTTSSEAMIMAGIGRDLVTEGGGESLLRVVLAMVDGQVPPQMRMAVATQILVDCASAAASASVAGMPIREAREALIGLAETFGKSALSRLDAIHPEGTTR